MLIQELVRKDFKTVKPYKGVQAIKNDLVDKNALVVMDKGEYLGILTPSDVVIKAHNLVIDCMLPKPSITSKDFIETALNIMATKNVDVLSVIDEGTFTGVVYKTDLMLMLQKVNIERQDHIRSIVHDLRNPIANISGLTEMLKPSLEDDKKELLSYAEDACVFANDIINDLLISAEMEESNTPSVRHKTDIILFLKSCLQNISGSALVKNIEVKDALPNIVFNLKIDTLKFKRAILNLLSNAIKFTAEGGWVKIGAIVKGNKITIAVTDNGIGIPKPLQPIIFEKFTQAKRRGTNNEKSTGLGMYITKQLITQHNGKIWVESKKNQGTTFFIKLETTESENKPTQKTMLAKR
jgi:signal transduction histidine kinase